MTLEILPDNGDNTSLEKYLLGTIRKLISEAVQLQVNFNSSSDRLIFVPGMKMQIRDTNPEKKSTLFVTSEVDFKIFKLESRKIADLIGGTRVAIATQILDSWLKRWENARTAFLERLERGDVSEPVELSAFLHELRQRGLLLNQATYETGDGIFFCAPTALEDPDPVTTRMEGIRSEMARLDGMVESLRTREAIRELLKALQNL